MSPTVVCRDAFRRTGRLSKIIPDIEEVLSAGDLPRPDPTRPDAIGPTFGDEAPLGISP